MTTKKKPDPVKPVRAERVTLTGPLTDADVASAAQSVGVSDAVIIETNGSN